jgi:hypothetical protein
MALPFSHDAGRLSDVLEERVQEDLEGGLWGIVAVTLGDVRAT